MYYDLFFLFYRDANATTINIFTGECCYVQHKILKIFWKWRWLIIFVNLAF